MSKITKEHLDRFRVGKRHVVLSLGTQIVGEMVAINRGEWAYNDAMPLTPLLRVGLRPALQMASLILPTFWLAQRVAHSYARQMAGMKTG